MLFRSASIAGIGLNLNQVQFDSGAINPTSLKILTSKEEDYCRKEELNNLLDNIFHYYQMLINEEVSIIENEYLKLLYRNDNTFYSYKEIAPEADLNIPIEKIKEGEIIEAKIIDVSCSGCLVLEHKSGNIKEYAFKEIQYIL